MRFLPTFALAAMFVAFFSLSARAGEQCYNINQLEAEQGLRIHSELMIIALNCPQYAPNGIPLNHQYEQFTRNNLDLIQAYENTMRGVFQAEGKGAGESDLNAFRTMLANRIAGEAVRLQPNVFCRAYSDRIIQASGMPREKFRKWAQTVFPGYPLTRRICDGVAVATQIAPTH